LASAKTYPYTVIPAGVADLAGGRTRASLTAELRIPEAAYLLAAVGRLETRSRLKDLIWATDIVKFMRDDVHLLVVGDGPHRARLERFMRQCRVSDKVHFLGDRPDLHEWLGVVDVFLSASERPGQPLALLEAMATGRPVISTEVAGRADLIQDGRNGFLVPLGDRHLLARSIHRLVTDAALRRMLGEQAASLVRDHFSASVAIEHWADTYDRLASHQS
jgi:glycosyltransferase involved in cell wall biosynthesis